MKKFTWAVLKLLFRIVEKFVLRINFIVFKYIIKWIILFIFIRYSAELHYFFCEYVTEEEFWEDLRRFIIISIMLFVARIHERLTTKPKPPICDKCESQLSVPNTSTTAPSAHVHATSIPKPNEVPNEVRCLIEGKSIITPEQLINTQIFVYVGSISKVIVVAFVFWFFK